MEKKPSRFTLSEKPYAIIGDGRTARHFVRYFSMLRIPFRQWSRKIALETGKTPEQSLKNCGIVLVLIKDSAIEDFIRKHPSIGGKKFIHFSGSLVSTLAEGMHPLAAFAQRLFRLPQYESIPFITEKNASRFSDVFPRLKNPSYAISGKLKPFYHSLCVMSGNFSTVLWQKLFSEFDNTLGIPRKAAVRYLQCVCDNISEDHKNSLSGPLSRGDKSTVAANLKALSKDPFRKIYRAFAATFTPEFASKK